ncbi:hypothetical protein NDU88_001509 [Pleurodeles waltl]|uniref:Uncharacterized protein n=1 Tax=Pleurodeles waltl TaxID=8319 RepID=A0AAV7P3Z1_PLEWA|nr:hypothetical protein NDU88_001509 [Pleurodeles waltl]
MVLGSGAQALLLALSLLWLPPSSVPSPPYLARCGSKGSLSVSRLPGGVRSRSGSLRQTGAQSWASHPCASPSSLLRTVLPPLQTLRKRRGVAGTVQGCGTVPPF